MYSTARDIVVAESVAVAIGILCIPVLIVGLALPVHWLLHEILSAPYSIAAFVPALAVFWISIVISCKTGDIIKIKLWRRRMRQYHRRAMEKLNADIKAGRGPTYTMHAWRK